MVILSACCQFLQLTNHCNLKKKKREYRLTEKDHSIFHQCPIKSLSKIHFCHYNLWSPFKNRMPDQNLFKLFALRARSSATITCLQLQQCHFTPAQIHTSNMLNLLSSLYLLFIPWNKMSDNAVWRRLNNKATCTEGPKRWQNLWPNFAQRKEYHL